MKLIFITLFFAGMFLGCENFRGPTGPPGKDLTSDTVIIDFEFTRNDLTVISETAFYEFGIPEITEDVVRSGIVIVYRKVGETLQAMPFTVSWDYGDPLSVEYIIDVGYIYGVGFVSIIETASFGTAEKSVCIDGAFRVVILSAKDF